MKDFTLGEAQVKEGLTQRKAAKNALEAAFTTNSGVTNETIRRNKATECLKTIFPHRSVLSIAAAESGDISSDPMKDLARIVSTIKRKVQHKTICGKAVNGNMFLALSLEYAETLSQPAQSTLGIPGIRGTNMHSLVPLFQAYSRVAEEETIRIADTVLADF